MDAWQLVPQDHVMSLFNLPADLAHSPDHHFYIPHDFETNDYFQNHHRFQFLGFIRPVQKQKYNYISFRFWSLHNEWLMPTTNILLPDWSGRIDIYLSEIDNLKMLLRGYGHTLRETDIKKPMFQLIPRKDYEKFQIDTSYTSQRVKIYLCDPDTEPYIDDHSQDTHKILGVTFESQKIALRTMFVPTVLDPGFQFHNGWLHGQGWLNMTKQGIEEFCKILEDR